MVIVSINISVLVVWHCQCGFFSHRPGLCSSQFETCTWVSLIQSIIMGTFCDSDWCLAEEKNDSTFLLTSAQFSFNLKYVRYVQSEKTWQKLVCANSTKVPIISFVICRGRNKIQPNFQFTWDTFASKFRVLWYLQRLKLKAAFWSNSFRFGSTKLYDTRQV